MLRRIIAVFLIFSHLGVLTTSCTNEHAAGPEPKGPPDRGAAALGAVNDPGQLHNDILEEFNQGNVRVSGEALEENAFIERFLDATDNVLSRRGIAVKMDRADVERILDRFEAYQSFGLFNLYSPDSDRIRAIDYSVERGDLNAIEAERLHGVFRELEQIGFSPSSQGRVHRLISSQMKRFPIHCDNRIVHDVLDVAEHSYRFWTDLAGEMPARVKAEDGPERVSLRLLQIIAADAIALLSFPSGRGGDVIAAAAVSIMFSMLMHAGD